MEKILGKHLAGNPATHKGRKGELLVVDNELRILDGSTPGGIVVGGSGSGLDIRSSEVALTYTPTFGFGAYRPVPNTYSDSWWYNDPFYGNLYQRFALKLWNSSNKMFFGFVYDYSNPQSVANRPISISSSRANRPWKYDEETESYEMVDSLLITIVMPSDENGYIADTHSLDILFDLFNDNRDVYEPYGLSLEYIDLWPESDFSQNVHYRPWGDDPSFEGFYHDHAEPMVRGTNGESRFDGNYLYIWSEDYGEWIVLDARSIDNDTTSIKTIRDYVDEGDASVRTLVNDLIGDIENKSIPYWESVQQVPLRGYNVGKTENGVRYAAANTYPEGQGWSDGIVEFIDSRVYHYDVSQHNFSNSSNTIIMGLPPANEYGERKSIKFSRSPLHDSNPSDLIIATTIQIFARSGSFKGQANSGQYFKYDNELYGKVVLSEGDIVVFEWSMTDNKWKIIEFTSNVELENQVIV